MPRITIEAINGGNGPRRWTLRERIVAENLDSDHYVYQLIERLTWATADAQDLEANLSEVDQSDPAEARRFPPAARTRRDNPLARVRARRMPGKSRVTT